jgi:hypothetical protein
MKPPVEAAQVLRAEQPTKPKHDMLQSILEPPSFSNPTTELPATFAGKCRCKRLTQSISGQNKSTAAKKEPMAAATKSKRMKNKPPFNPQKPKTVTPASAHSRGTRTNCHHQQAAANSKPHPTPSTTSLNIRHSMATHSTLTQAKLLSTPNSASAVKAPFGKTAPLTKLFIFFKALVKKQDSSWNKHLLLHSAI